MDKHKAKEFLKNLAGNTVIPSDDLKYIELGSALYVVDKIEPEKQELPEIPQYVADWVEYSKATFCSLKGTISFDEIYTYNYANWSRDKVKLISWMSDEENQDIFARAWLYGYTVEKPKLYTVEIPDPHGLYEYRYLCKHSNGLTMGANDGDFWKGRSDCQLTEAEIKEDFE
ncbi:MULTISPECIES: DUF1642 domain-containing protein [Streptococcus]|nr:DUF1642 domain-containing protein [Streptococcus acidominimus]